MPMCWNSLNILSLENFVLFKNKLQKSEASKEEIFNNVQYS